MEGWWMLEFIYYFFLFFGREIRLKIFRYNWKISSQGICNALQAHE